MFQWMVSRRDSEEYQSYDIGNGDKAVTTGFIYEHSSLLYCPDQRTGKLYHDNIFFSIFQPLSHLPIQLFNPQIKTTLSAWEFGFVLSFGVAGVDHRRPLIRVRPVFVFSFSQLLH